MRLVYLTLAVLRDRFRAHRASSGNREPHGRFNSMVNVTARSVTWTDQRPIERKHCSASWRLSDRLALLRIAQSWFTLANRAACGTFVLADNADAAFTGVDRGSEPPPAIPL
jgi:hypothetical protein